MPGMQWDERAGMITAIEMLKSWMIGRFIDCPSFQKAMDKIDEIEYIVKDLRREETEIKLAEKDNFKTGF